MKYKEFLEAVKEDVNYGYKIDKCIFGDEILKLNIKQEESAIVLVQLLHVLFKKAYEKGWRKYYMTICIEPKDSSISLFLREILSASVPFPEIIDVTEM